MSNKGKYLPFEDSSMSSFDDEGGSDQIERNIESDSAIINSLTLKISNIMNKNPLDSQFILIAALKGFGKGSEYYTNMLKDIIEEISDKMYQKFPEFYNALFNSFLFNLDPLTGQKHLGKDIRENPIGFLDSCLALFRKHNTKDANILKVKALLKEMLTKHSVDYLSFKDVQKRNLEKAIFAYFILMCRRV